MGELDMKSPDRLDEAVFLAQTQGLQVGYGACDLTSEDR